MRMVFGCELARYTVKVEKEKETTVYKLVHFYGHLFSEQICLGRGRLSSF